MSIRVQFRRGTSTQHNSFTGANGEVTVDTTIKTLRVHDGSTVGGIRIAKYSELGAAANLLSISSALIPSANNTYNLGSPTNRWHGLYLTGNTIYLGGTTISRNVDGSLRIANEGSNTLATIQVSAVNTTTPSNFGNVTISNLVLSSVLKTSYGGTGLTSFTAKGVLYASNTSSLAFATGAQGKVFQAGSGGVPVFDDLDGGSF